MLEIADTSGSSAKYVGSPNAEIEKIYWDGKAVWIDEAHTNGFEGVDESVWKYHIGGFHICKKWLDDRRKAEWKLSKDDIQSYLKIISALSETINVTAEIDRIIDLNGGWPKAFQ